MLVVAVLVVASFTFIITALVSWIFTPKSTSYAIKLINIAAFITAVSIKLFIFSAITKGIRIITIIAFIIVAYVGTDFSLASMLLLVIISMSFAFVLIVANVVANVVVLLTW